MATSIYASPVEDKLDPKARNPFAIPLQPALEAEEKISSWEIVLSPEAVALGLTVFGAADGKTDPGLIEDDRAIGPVWLGIDPAFFSDPVFEAAGKFLSFEVFYETDATPPREDNRTLIIQVANL